MTTLLLQFRDYVFERYGMKDFRNLFVRALSMWKGWDFYRLMYGHVKQCWESKMGRVRNSLMGRGITALLQRLLMTIQESVGNNRRRTSQRIFQLVAAGSSSSSSPQTVHAFKGRVQSHPRCSHCLYMK